VPDYRKQMIRPNMWTFPMSRNGDGVDLRPDGVGLVGLVVARDNAYPTRVV
jgi:hypothetical protein